MTTALEGLRILDLARPEGQMCGRILADLGAEVIKIEPPTGDSGRHVGPFKSDIPDLETSLSFCNLNSGKKSVVLDLHTSEGREIFLAHLGAVDIIIDSGSPGELQHYGLDYKLLQKRNPRLIVASISGFGITGPYKHLKAPNIACAAMGGLMSLCGSKDRPPLVEPYDHMYHAASVHAAYGILLAVRHRDLAGTGQLVEVSCQEIQASGQHIIVNYSANENILNREGSRTPTGGGMPYGIFPTKDGFCHLVVISTAHWHNFLNWIGNPESLSDSLWDNRHVRISNSELIEELTVQFTQESTKAELFDQGQRRHLTIAPVNTPNEFIDDVNTVERDSFQLLDHPVIGQCKLIRPPYRMTESPAGITHCAPVLGENTIEFLNSKKKPSNTTRESGNQKVLPLEGVRILDFSQAVAGPVLTQSLAAFGAEIIKVESSTHQQRGRSGPNIDNRIALQQKVTFADVNRNKRSITVNMSEAKGVEVIKKLLPHCDVVVENFSPRVMEKWGLGYDDIRLHRADVIMARLPGFGLTGPYRDNVGLAAVAMGITGMYHLWSYDDEPEPAGPPVWVPDYLSAAFGDVAIMAALRYREQTGKGQMIELSQVDATAFLLGTTYLDCFVNGRSPQPIGNGSVNCAPHGVYKCRGEDQWCVISVRDDEEWMSFMSALKSPHWAEDKNFSTVEGRLSQRKKIDQYISEWTTNLTPHQVMQILQNAGVPAAAVQNGEHLFMDPHLRDRGFMTTIDHPTTGPIEYPGLGVGLSKTPECLSWWHSMGEDNEYVFGTLLNMNTYEIEELKKAGVLI